MNGKTLRILRVSRGLRQHDFAQLLKIKQTTVSKLELDYYPITPEIEGRVREVLGIDDKTVERVTRVSEGSA